VFIAKNTYQPVTAARAVQSRQFFVAVVVPALTVHAAYMVNIFIKLIPKTRMWIFARIVTNANLKFARP
jgi:hypothetical protein